MITWFKESIITSSYRQSFNFKKKIFSWMLEIKDYDNFLGRKLHQIHTKTRKKSCRNICICFWIGYTIKNINILTIRYIYLP